MGNQCCETGTRTGELSKVTLSKYNYTFQEDHQELPNPILASSKVTMHAPPN
jgi:hypothetical protein